MDSSSSSSSSSTVGNNNAYKTPMEVQSAQQSALADCRYKYATDPAIVDPFVVEIMRLPNGEPLLDHNEQVIPVSKILATKPLRRDILTRPGPGGKQLSYMSGECVSRMMNEIFGYDGWSLEIKSTKQESMVKDEKNRYSVAYTAVVRVTHRKSGAFKEDCGAGDSTDRSIGTAVAHAMKSAVTDAMKRASRHFGEKLGNSLYEKGFGINRAPGTLQKALDNYEVDQKVSKFGFKKKVAVKTEDVSSDQKPSPISSSCVSNTNNIQHPDTTHNKNITPPKNSAPTFQENKNHLQSRTSNVSAASFNFDNKRRNSTGNAPTLPLQQNQAAYENRKINHGDTLNPNVPTVNVNRKPVTKPSHSTNGKNFEQNIAAQNNYQPMNNQRCNADQPSSNVPMNKRINKLARFAAGNTQLKNSAPSHIDHDAVATPLHQPHQPPNSTNSYQSAQNQNSNISHSSSNIPNNHSTNTRTNQLARFVAGAAKSPLSAPSHRNQVTQPRNPLADRTNSTFKRPSTARGQEEATPEAKKPATATSRNPYGKAASSSF